MSSIGTGYDLSTSTFSPDGRVFQVDYAQKAVESSGTAIAIRGKDGVVFAVEKIITSKLYEKSANRRIFSIDRHIGMAGSGLYADVRQLGMKKLRIFDYFTHFTFNYSGYRHYRSLELHVGLWITHSCQALDRSRVQLHSCIHFVFGCSAFWHHHHVWHLY